MTRTTLNETGKKLFPVKVNHTWSHTAVRSFLDHGWLSADIPSLKKPSEQVGQDFSKLQTNTNLAKYSKIDQIITCPPQVQAKLNICQPDDEYEQEADRVANMVMRTQNPWLQRQPELFDTKRIIPKANNVSGFVPLALEDQIYSLQGGGQSLSEQSRSFFEAQFHHDLSQVRVHTDSQAVRMANVLNARAFTSGNNIVFDQGQYSPESYDGKILLAHELTHVIQQNQNSTKSTPDSINMVQATFWDEPISKDVNEFENKSAEVLTLWLMASYQAINDLVDHIFSDRLDKIESGDWNNFMVTLIGNTIWAASAFAPNPTSMFAISMAGVLIGMPSVPIPVSGNKDKIKDSLNKYVEDFHGQLRKQIASLTKQYESRNPQMNGYAAISDFMKNNFKKELYSLQDVIPLLNNTAVRRTMYNKALALWEHSKAFSNVKIDTLREPITSAQRGLNRLVERDAEKEIGKMLPKVLAYQQTNRNEGVLFIIVVEESIYRQPPSFTNIAGGERNKRLKKVECRLGGKTRDQAIKDYQKPMKYKAQSEKGWSEYEVFHWIPPLRW